jgi:hypothetical protein
MDGGEETHRVQAWVGRRQLGEKIDLGFPFFLLSKLPPSTL